MMPPLRMSIFCQYGLTANDCSPWSSANSWSPCPGSPRPPISTKPPKGSSERQNSVSQKVFFQRTGPTPIENVGVRTLKILQKIKCPNSCTVTIDKYARIDPASGSNLLRRPTRRTFSDIRNPLIAG